MKLLRDSQINRAQWESFVRKSRTGTWFQTPAAFDFFASLPDFLTPFAFAVERDGQLRAVCVGYVTRERNPLKQFFTRRAIILGGPCLADDASEEEVVTLLSPLSCRRLRRPVAKRPFTLSPIYIESRNFNDYSPWRQAFEKAGFAYRKHLNFHVDPSADNLSDNRRRQLKKSTAVVSEAGNENDILEWYQVLAQLYRTKVKTPLWPEYFFVEAFRQGIAHFLLVKHQGTIIGGSMIVADDRCAYEWYECGLNAEYKEQYPSVLATCAGIQFARTNALPRYDMMGAGEPDVPYGVRDFKAEFGGQLVEHGRFLAIRHPLLYRLGSLGVRFLKR